MKVLIMAALAAFFALPFSSLAGSLAKAPAWSAFESFAFDDSQGHKTNSLLVIKNGMVAFERYRSGFNANTPQQLWSVSKSISGLLIGKAYEDGLLKISAPVKNFYDDAPEGVTVEHLLNMVSGYKWNEGYEYSPLSSDVIAMLYVDHNDDMAKFAATKPLAYKPDEVFQYSSGTTNILMGILSKAVGPGDYAKYPWRALFNPMNISKAIWERDHKGTFIGSSYLYLSARDLAKFGELFLNKGKIGDKQIISEKWLEASSITHPYFLNPERSLKESENFAYSRQWWLNTALPFPDGSKKSRYPSLPENAILALGHWGQMMVILPSERIVLVRTGEDKSGRMNRDEFFSLFMRALRQSQP